MDSRQAKLRNSWSEKPFPRWPWNFMLSWVSDTLISHQTPRGTDQWVSEDNSTCHRPPPKPSHEEHMAPSILLPWSCLTGTYWLAAASIEDCIWTNTFTCTTEMALLLIRGSASEVKRASFTVQLMQRAAIYLYIQWILKVHTEKWKSRKINNIYKYLQKILMK